MEIHRLKEMQSDYDVKLFNKLYKEIQPLRNSLVFQIDSRRYGVTPDIIRSWFDDKFIFVFNKYYGKLPNEVLKGFIINALKTFKFRVLRNAYAKHNLYRDEIHLEDQENLINIIPSEEEINNHDLFMELALAFLEKNISEDAFTILNLELNPPPYILKRIKSTSTKIPSHLLAEYLDLENNSDNIFYINQLRKEINLGIEKAKNYFMSPSNMQI